MLHFPQDVIFFADTGVILIMLEARISCFERWSVVVKSFLSNATVSSDAPDQKPWLGRALGLPMAPHLTPLELDKIQQWSHLSDSEVLERIEKLRHRRGVDPPGVRQIQERTRKGCGVQERPGESRKGRGWYTESPAQPKPSPTQPNPAQPSQAQPSLAQPNPAQNGLSVQGSG